MTCWLRIIGSSFGVLLTESSTAAELLQLLTLDIARLLGVATEYVVIDSLTIGSLLVNFTVTAGALATTNATAIASTLTAAAAPNASVAWLAQTQALYATVSNETLYLDQASTTVILAPLATTMASFPQGCGGGCTLFYAGLAVAGAVFVAVVGLIAVMLWKRHRRPRTGPDAKLATDGRNTKPPTDPAAAVA